VTAAVLFAVMQPVFTTPARAQFTVLPYTDMTAEGCIARLNDYEVAPDQKQFFTGDSRNSTLACGIKTGRISLAMIPYFITYFANFLLSIVGLISMLFIVIGGYWYIFGGITDNKEKGKKFIANALKGLVVAILAWVIVSVIINLVTS